MHKYLLKRLLSLIPVLFVVSLAIFLLIHLVPGDPAAAILGEEASPEQIAALRETLGFNDPLPVQYFRWVAGLFRGDWGTSFFMEGTMLEIIGSHMIPTLQQTLVAVGFATLVGVPLGMIAAIRHGSPTDRIISAFSSVGISLPSFLMGLCLVLLISVKLRWLPSSGYKSIADFGWQTHIRYMLLPGIALGFIEMGLRGLHAHGQGKGGLPAEDVLPARAHERADRDSDRGGALLHLLPGRRHRDGDDLQHPRPREAHAQRRHAPGL